MITITCERVTRKGPVVEPPAKPPIDTTPARVSAEDAPIRDPAVTRDVGTGGMALRRRDLRDHACIDKVVVANTDGVAREETLVLV